MKLVIKAQGFAAAGVKIEQLATKGVRKAVRGAVNAGSKIMLAAAKAGAPEDTKSLKKALGRKVKSYQKGQNVTAFVGARKDAVGKPAKYRRTVVRRGSTKETIANPANYILLVTKGTKPHALGKGSRRNARRKGGFVGQSGKLHPGAAANPFMRRALDATVGQCDRLARLGVVAAVVNAGVK